MRNWKDLGENDTLERKLEIVEQQVGLYELEIERIELRRNRRIEEEKKEIDSKNKRMEQKRRNEQHWEMMRWITKFMKENSNKWEMRRETEMERIRWEEKRLNWEKMTDIEVLLETHHPLLLNPQLHNWEVLHRVNALINHHDLPQVLLH